jgi:hypothetical protein
MLKVAEIFNANAKFFFLKNYSFPYIMSKSYDFACVIVKMLKIENMKAFPVNQAGRSVRHVLHAKSLHA